MRSGIRKARQEEEEESAFVSMTDMTVSFLFIVMILLAFFATQFSDEDMVPRADLVEMQARRDAAIAERDAALLREQTLRHERDALRERIGAIEIALGEAVRARDAALREITWLEALLRQLSQDHDEALAQLNSAISARDLARAERDRAIAEHEAALEDLDEALRERDDAQADLARLRSQLERLDRDNLRLEARVAELESLIASLERRDPLEAYLAMAAAERLRILQELRERLLMDFPDLLIQISAESDALRFQGEGLFNTGSSTLRADKREIVAVVADRLADILPCYTLGERMLWQPDCNPGFAVIEAVQIEGHTDARGEDLYNLDLSTARANATFAAMLRRRDDLTRYLNFRLQPVLSVAGYGKMRPVADNETDEGRATNRRIDLRIIMHTPVTSDEIARIRARLRGEETDP